MNLFKPVLVLEVEISQRISDVPLTYDHTGTPYQRARSLVRLHDKPLGLVDLNIDGTGLTASEHAAAIWRKLGNKINAHLRANGLPEVSTLDESGIPFEQVPACVQARNQFLANAPFASVIVCTRDRAASLGRCVRSLLKLDYPAFEIIVVDNAPKTNATEELVAQEFGQNKEGHQIRVRYIREPRPGKSRAANTGALHARGAILAFTDDDVEVDRHWLTELALGFTVTDHVACVSGLILPAELETQPQFWQEEFGGYNRDGNLDQRIFNLENLRWRRQQEPLYPYTSGNFGAGANLCFSREAFMKLDGFDPAIGAGTLTIAAEDTDILFRSVISGYTVVRQPAAFLYHYQYRDYESLRKQLFSYGHGFTAHLMNCILRRPSSILDFVSMVPYTLFYLFNSKSPKHAKKKEDFPKELATAEMKGMTVGWWAYLRSRWRTGNERRLAQAPSNKWQMTELQVASSK